jgi:peroxiredoxin
MLCLAVSQAMASGWAGAEERTIEDFALRDYRGQEQALSRLAGRRLTVVAFLGVECPLAKLYAPRLASLAREYRPRGVAFVAIDSNRQDLPSEMAHYARQHGLPFAFLKDPGNQIADRFGAARTPEVFVLDDQSRVRYQGRVDDQYQPGIQAARVRRHDLKQALEELLAGKAVSQPRTPAAGCLIGRMPRTPERPDGEPITWCNQISRIFQKHCQECHRPGEIGPMPFLSYADVQGWEAMIGEVVAQGRMPPWHANPQYGQFVNDIRLSDEEKALVAAWVAAGAPEGDRRDLPEPVNYPEGWHIPPPDQVVYMSDKPFTVPAEGTVEYQYFVVDPGFRRDRWIKGLQCRPGNRAVVHHINVFVLLPEIGDHFERDQLTNHLLWAYSPGFRGVTFPPGTARHVPAGSKLVFQMHYSPNGTPQEDRSFLGINFTDESSVTESLEIGLAVNNAFTIPPYAPRGRVVSWYEFKQTGWLVALHPHMHLRGRDFRFEAIYPDGRMETLLDVPRFDFNWQYDYRLAQPLKMPLGTKICCTAHYDNSPDNPTNPDPAAIVRWGDQTWQEMMIGYLHIARPYPPSEVAATAESASTHGWKGWGAVGLVGATLLAILFGCGSFFARRLGARCSAAQSRMTRSTP